MLIGEDYDKISFRFLDLDLLEPNAFIGDFILFVISIYLASKARKLYLSEKNNFFLFWAFFFLIFGVGFLSGGLGHLLFNYWGVEGKYPSWFLGISAATCIELGMAQLFAESVRKKLIAFIVVKLVIVLAVQTLIVTSENIHSDPSLGMILPTAHSSIALITFLGVFGFIFSKKIDPGFRYFYLSVLVLFPSVIVQSFKINPAQWFDKNDVAHILLIVSLFLYYKGVKSYSDYLKSSK